MQPQLILTVFGVSKGEFKPDDGGPVRGYGAIFAGQDLSGDNAIGISAEKMKADPAVFDAIKTSGAKLPAQFICDVSMKVSQAGTQVRVLNAKLLKS